MQLGFRRRVGLLAAVLAIGASLQPSAQTTTRTSGAPRRSASIAGRVIHADGAAAEGARVAVYAVVEGAPGGIVAMTTSGHDGRYEVKGLAPGPVMIGVTPRKASGFGGDLKRAPAVASETFYPGVTERDRAQPITVFEALPVEGIDVWLAPAPQRFSISGRIFWTEGTEVENLVIEYSGAGGIRRGVWHVHDPGGLFTIEGAAQGTYVLIARGETGTGPLLGIAATDVASGPVEDVRLMLRAPGSIDGRIVIDGPAPASSPAFHITPVQTLITLSPLYPAEDAAVSPDGRFTVPHVAGEYVLSVHGLPSNWRVRRVLRNGAILTDGRIVVPPGERVTGIEIVVGPGTT